MISDLLTKSFDDIIDVEYTRNLEEDLDKIEEGKTDYVQYARRVLQEVQEGPRTGRQGDAEPQGRDQDRRGVRPVRLADADQVGKFGPFVACSAYPECTNTREIENSEPESESGEEEIEPCENCGRPMVVKRGRFGQFLACTGYPECKTTRKLIATKQGGLRAAKPDQILDEKCPRCESNLVLKQGRYGEFTACTNYPECRYIKHKTTGVKCPKDADKGGEIVERKSRRGKTLLRVLELPGLRFRAVESSGCRRVSEVRRAVTSSRRSPRSTAVRFSATTKNATTHGRRNCPEPPRNVNHKGHQDHKDHKQGRVVC